MALLIAELALPADRLGSAKVGILSASVLAAVCGLALLTWLTGGRRRRSRGDAALAGRD
jgi:Na+/H+ antiporter NhaA